MKNAAEVSQHQNGEFRDVFLIEGVAESRGDVGVAVAVETVALGAARVHLAVAGAALLARVEHLQRSFVFIDSHLQLRVAPQEPRHLAGSHALLVLVDLHDAVAELLVVLLEESVHLEAVAVELLGFGGRDGRAEDADVLEGELREVQLEVDLVEVDCDFGLSGPVDFDLGEGVGDCGGKGRLFALRLLLSVQLS